MAPQKNRKKLNATVTTATPNSGPAIAVLETAPRDDAEDHPPMMQQKIARDAHGAAQRPAWIDGAPVTPDGQFIRQSESHSAPLLEQTDPMDDNPHDQQDQPSGQRNWGDPYKSIFNCREMGFELGENRRFKQRVFMFAAKPSAEILAVLKEHGFIYRSSEKAWTIQANADTRKLTDELARQWAGPNYVQGIER